MIKKGENKGNYMEPSLHQSLLCYCNFTFFSIMKVKSERVIRRLTLKTLEMLSLGLVHFPKGKKQELLGKKQIQGIKGENPPTNIP